MNAKIDETEICCGNCNVCNAAGNCPYEEYDLLPEEYDMSRDIDRQIVDYYEPKPIDMKRYVRNRPDKEAYTKARDKELEHARYWKDPEKSRKKALDRYYKSREKILERRKEYYRNNSGEKKAKSKARYHMNKTQISEIRRDKRLAMKEVWSNVVKGTFMLNGGKVKELIVIKQKTLSNTHLGVGYQISQVVDTTSTPLSITKTGLTFPFKYLYEEIDLDDDTIMDSKFISINTVKKNYGWFLEEDNQ